MSHSSLPKGVTPFERFFGRKPDVSNLRVFGCKAWIHVHKDKRKGNMDARGQAAIMLGYAAQRNGYDLYNLATNKVVSSRDVQFEENVFPLKGEHPPRIVTSNLQRDNEVVTTPSGPLSAPMDSLLFPAVPSPTTLAVVSSSPASVPKTIHSAMCSEKRDHWLDAVTSELDSLLSNHTWDLVPVPKDRKRVQCKWVFDTKLDQNGEIVRYKARLVARGFTQIQGQDYFETFAPVESAVSYRVLLAIAAELEYHIAQLDVSTAFLNGELEETIFMTVPDLPPELRAKVPTHDVHGQPLCCKLVKSLYGLKQSSRVWNLHLHKTLISLEFKQTVSDPCVYVLQRAGGHLILAVHVDDITLFSNLQELIKWVKDKLSEPYKIKDIGELKWCLGIEVNRPQPHVIHLNQSLFARKALEDLGMGDSKPMKTPAEHKTMLSKDQCPEPDSEEALNMLKVPYRSAVGSLNYLTIRTRPDLSYAVGTVARFNQNPGEIHWTGVKRILRYLRGTLDKGIRYTGSGHRDAKRLILEVYCDSDFGGDHDNSVSITGFVIFLAGGPICWGSLRQRHVERSTTAAEYIAMSEALLEVVWLRGLLRELGFEQTQPTVVRVDNQSAIAMARNPLTTKRARQIRIAYHLVVREFTRDDGEVVLEHVSGSENTADVFTKALSPVVYGPHRDKLVTDVPQPTPSN